MCEHDFLARVPVFFKHFMQTGTGKDFVARVHSGLGPREKVSHGGGGGKPGSRLEGSPGSEAELNAEGAELG